MKICKNCGSVYENGALCPECGSVLRDMSADEEKAYSKRLGRTVSEQSSRSFGLYSTLSDRVLGSVSLFCMALHGLCLLWASKAPDPENVSAYSAAGIVLCLIAAVVFLAPKLLWAVSSIRLRLMTDEPDPQPSALWVTVKNFMKYGLFALGMTFLLLSLIEIL